MFLNPCLRYFCKSMPCKGRHSLKLIASLPFSQNVFLLCHSIWHKICRISCRLDASSPQAHATELLYLRRNQFNFFAKGEEDFFSFLLFSSLVEWEFFARCFCRSRWTTRLVLEGTSQKFSIGTCSALWTNWSVRSLRCLCFFFDAAKYLSLFNRATIHLVNKVSLIKSFANKWWGGELNADTMTP